MQRNESEFALNKLYQDKEQSIRRAKEYDQEETRAHLKIQDEIRFLAKTMEQIYIINNTPDMISTISSQIRGIYKENGITAWVYVSRKLDDKYKNPEEIRIGRQNHPGNNDIDRLLEEKEKQQYVLHNSYANDDNIAVEDFNKYIETPALLKEEPVHIRQQITEKALKRRKGLDTLIEVAKQNARDEGWAVYDEDSHFTSKGKDWPTYSTELPDPRRGPWYDSFAALLKVSDEIVASVITWNRNLHAVRDNIEKFPLPDEKDEHEYVRATNKFVYEVLIPLKEIIFDMLGEFIEPEKDLKYAQSIPGWWRTMRLYGKWGKHAGAVKTLIPSHKDPTKLRPLTREDVGDKAEYYANLALRAYKGTKLLVKLGQWRDMVQSPRAAHRRLEMEEKLSDLSIG